MQCAAVTTKDSSYPAYINFTRNSDGSVSVFARGAPIMVDGTYVCGFAHNKGQAGRCTPGDEHCNNYCNMAPQNGPMVDHPKVHPTFARCGADIALTLTAEEFADLRSSIAALA